MRSARAITLGNIEYIFTDSLYAHSLDAIRAVLNLFPVQGLPRLTCKPGDTHAFGCILANMIVRNCTHTRSHQTRSYVTLRVRHVRGHLACLSASINPKQGGWKSPLLLIVENWIFAYAYWISGTGGKNGASTEWVTSPKQGIGYHSCMIGAECDAQRETGNEKRSLEFSSFVADSLTRIYTCACTRFLACHGLTYHKVARVVLGAYPFSVVIRRLLLLLGLLDEEQFVDTIDRGHCGGSAHNREANATARRMAMHAHLTFQYHWLPQREAKDEKCSVTCSMKV